MMQDYKTPQIVLFGASSIAGYNLSKAYPDLIRPYIPPKNKARFAEKWEPLYLAEPGWAEKIFARNEFHTLVYFHAVCDVPKCEADPEWAFEVNVRQLEQTLSCLPEDKRFVYISSDHVFGEDGVYTEESETCPISVYGKTRVAAEELVMKRANSLILRMGLSIGSSPEGRTGHLDWLQYRKRKGLPITIVEDESRSVTKSEDLSKRIMEFVLSNEVGIRHVVAKQIVSRVALAKHLIRTFNIGARFQTQKRSEQPAPHIGKIDLRSIYKDKLSEPLGGVG